MKRAGSRTFRRMRKSEANAHKQLPAYVLKPFSSFRIQSAEIRKKRLKTHSGSAPENHQEPDQNTELTIPKFPAKGVQNEHDA